MEGHQRCAVSGIRIGSVSSSRSSSCPPRSRKYCFGSPNPVVDCCRCSPTSTDLMLEPILSLLCTLQQLPCGALNQHLQDIFKFLSERVLFLTATDGQTAALSSCKLTVFRQLLTLQKLGDKHTQKLTATFRAFNDSLVSSSHPNNWCKSLNTADRVVLLFVELITGKPWLEPAFRHKLTSSLQTQATDSETHLANLWMYLAEALQVHLLAAGLHL